MWVYLFLKIDPLGLVTGYYNYFFLGMRKWLFFSPKIDMILRLHWPMKCEKH
jgi:hypothetical protein